MLLPIVCITLLSSLYHILLLNSLTAWRSKMLYLVLLSTVNVQPNFLFPFSFPLYSIVCIFDSYPYMSSFLNRAAKSCLKPPCRFGSEVFCGWGDELLAHSPISISEGHFSRCHQPSPCFSFGLVTKFSTGLLRSILTIVVSYTRPKEFFSLDILKL